MACDTFLTMLALPVLYLLFGKGPEVVDGSELDGMPAGTSLREHLVAGTP